MVLAAALGVALPGALAQTGTDPNAPGLSGKSGTAETTAQTLVIREVRLAGDVETVEKLAVWPPLRRALEGQQPSDMLLRLAQGRLQRALSMSGYPNAEVTLDTSHLSEDGILDLTANRDAAPKRAAAGPARYVQQVQAAAQRRARALGAQSDEGSATAAADAPVAATATPADTPTRATGPTRVDTDLDGLDDAWEFQYFGDLSQGGSTDTDGDGYTNLQEQQNQSDPSWYFIHLEPGWNMVSIARVPDDPSVQAIFGPGTLRAAYGWDAAASHYTAATTLDPLRGYWVYSAAATAVDVTIFQFTPVVTGSEYAVVDLSGGPGAGSYPVTFMAGPPADLLANAVYQTTSLVLRRVAAGTYVQGSPTGELGRQSNETQHEVTLSQPFYIGVFEVTQQQWQQVMGSNPSANSVQGPRYAVENVSWDVVRGGTWPAGVPGADTFLGRLRAKTILDFDLPTEAQWEYACRAGTTTALNNGTNLASLNDDPNLGTLGWYADNAAFIPHQVGLKTPNALGLYDMHGNVWEWCLDWQGTYPTQAVTDPVGAETGTDRIMRGGSWLSYADFCRSGFRSQDWASSFYDDYGLRVSAPAVLARSSARSAAATGTDTVGDPR